jgi:integrase
MYEKLPHGMGTVLTVTGTGARCPHGEAKCSCTIQARWLENGRSRKKNGFRDKTAAKHFLTGKYSQKEVEQGLAKKPRGKAPLFQDFAPGWLETRKTGKKKLLPKTVTRYQGNLRLFIYPYIGCIPIDKITRTHIQDLLTALESGKHYGNGKPVHPVAVRSVLYNILFPVFRKAMEDGWIKSNPAANHDIDEVPDSDRYLPSPNEVHQLANAIKPMFRLAVYLMAGCGLRAGEVLGLTVDCIEEDSLWIHRQWQGGEVGYGPLKHRKAGEGRRVPMDPVVRSELMHHFKTYDITEGPIFPSSEGNGNPFSPAALSKYFYHARLELGWKDKELTAHCLRHFYTSMSISRGIAITKVSKILGHRSIDFTYRIYYKLVKDDLLQTQQAVNGFLSAEIPDNVVVLGAHKLAPADVGAKVAELKAELQRLTGMDVILQPPAAVA